MDQLLAVKTIQQIINADPSAAAVNTILASAPADIQEEVRRQFRTNEKLRMLFPEYASLVE